VTSAACEDTNGDQWCGGSETLFSTCRSGGSSPEVPLHHARCTWHIIWDRRNLTYNAPNPLYHRFFGVILVIATDRSAAFGLETSMTARA